MSRRIVVLALAALWLAGGAPSAAGPRPLFGASLFASHPRPQAPDLTFDYRGWRVDARPAARTQPPERTVRAIKAQIDLVEGLGLPPPVIGVMRASPVVADGSAGREADRYGPGRVLLLRVKRLDAKKPALLHAALLAYQDQRLPEGFANPDVERFRQQAIARHVWPKTAMMLQNDAEFFADNAAAYLYGTITREPYTRANLRRLQPQLYQWMANLFDAGRPRR